MKIKVKVIPDFLGTYHRKYGRLEDVVYKVDEPELDGKTPFVRVKKEKSK